MNLRIITKNQAVDSKVGSLLKIDFGAEWTHESIPTAWDLNGLDKPTLLIKARGLRGLGQPTFIP